MNTSNPPRQTTPSAAVRAEAALWLAHLRGPERDADVERGFRLWLEAKPEHAVAFELASDIWERTGAVHRYPRERIVSWTQPGRRRGVRMMVAAAALGAVSIGVFVWHAQRDSVTTAVGEQRTVMLADGSRIFLNTDSHAAIRYSAHERHIDLDQGEAIFEVAREVGRPFVVSAGPVRIEALGTSFVVRRDPQKLSVTLVEGKVSIGSTEISAGEAAPQPAKILNPGERLTMNTHSAPVLDTPVLEKLTAWQRGQVAFDSVPLADAVAEMNRYSAKKLIVERPEAADILVGGIFRAGDAKSFAQAMAEMYRFKFIEEQERIVLAGAPTAPELVRRRAK